MANRNGAVTIAARSIRPLAIALIVVVAAAAAARGDWLVLTSGDEIETKGAWAVQGPKIVFTSTRGVLSSVRTSEVNVESSRALTAKKLEEASKVTAKPTPTPKRPPVLVLTDKDFAKEPTPAAGAEGVEAAAGEAPAEGEEGAPAAAPAAPAAEAASQAAVSAAAAPANAPAAAAAARAAGTAAPARITQPIVVPATDSLETRVAYQMPGPPALRLTSWSARPTGDDQLSIFGAVQNVGGRVAAAVEVTVTLFDSEGARIGSAQAAVSSTALMPNTQADFEARFDGSPNFAEVQFVARTTEIELSKPPNGGELDEPVGDEPHATARSAAPARPRS
jgi:hypothetical protein